MIRACALCFRRRIGGLDDEEVADVVDLDEALDLRLDISEDTVRGWRMPALLTRMSSPPKRSWTARTAEATCASSVVSQSHDSQTPPPERIWSRVAVASRRSRTPIRAPSAARRTPPPRPDRALHR
jgi:hypothetical protein